MPPPIATFLLTCEQEAEVIAAQQRRCGTSVLQLVDAVPEAELDGAVMKLAERMAGVPKNQLMMQKLMINQAYENMGLANTQMIATLFDGITRHSPEGQWFKHYAEEQGYKEAVRLRDSGEPIPGSKSYKDYE